MLTFSAWRPKILVEHGDQQLSEALRLLASYGPELDQPRRNQARGLVDYANDVKHILNQKNLLKQIKPARLYSRKASEALEAIRVMSVPRAVFLNTNTLNRPIHL